MIDDVFCKESSLVTNNRQRNSDRPNHVTDLESIFHHAIALANAERVRYLDQVCADNPTLRAEVEQLLAADDKAQTFMAGLENQLQTVLKHHQETGTQIGRYRIDRKIASGGMGSVYQAWDSRLNRDVALKFLHPHCALDPASKQRFVREALSISQLNHAHICTIFDVAETDAGEQYIVMELCTGRRLDELIQTNELTYEAIFSLSKQLCSALKVAHGNDILHRDLKPQNVIVDAHGNAKLLDFGIAKNLDAGSSATSQALGTVAYMSPEQFKASTQDARTDIWALGTLIFEMLIGVTPFRGDSQPAVMRAIFDRRRPSLKSLGSNVPDSFEQFFDRCLAHDVQDRFADMDALSSELDILRLHLSQYLSLTDRPQIIATRSDAPLAGHSSQNERRQISVLHYRATTPGGSDPEDQLVLLDQVREIFTKIVRRFGAYQFSVNSSDLIAYFGYPTSVEDSAAQSVRCALAIKEAMIRRQSRPGAVSCTSQIGVHTGLMIARNNDSTGGTELIGDGPAIAQKLAFNAGADQVVMSNDTELLVRGFFAINQLDTNAGMVFEVLSESTAKSKFDIAVQEGLTPLCGRVHELGMLAEAWDQTVEHEGRAVAISGEPGIGKSRLVYELKQQVASNADAWLVECQCSPYESNTTLYPFLQYFKQDVLQLNDELSTEQKASRIDGFLTEYDFADEDRRVLTDFFAEQSNVDSEQLISPEQRQRKIFAGLRRLLIQRAAFQPILLIIEDMHWADPSSNLMIEMMIQNALPENVMLILTFRPTFKPRWLSAESITRLVIQRLNKKDTLTLIDRLSGDQNKSFSVREKLVEKADGNPLFVETLARSVLDGDVGSLNAIPSTLQDSLAARLDQTGDAKIVAQYASVIGREFDKPLLESCIRLDGDTLDSYLAQLIDAQLLLAPSGPTKSYRFRHALIRDAAYDSLLKSDKASIHRAIAENLVNKPNASFALLANHYAAAGTLDEAARAWLRAAENSLNHAAALEAITLCGNGIEALGPDTLDEGLTVTKIDLLLTLGSATIAAKGYTDQSVESSYEQALSLSNKINSNEKRFASLFGASTVNIVSGQHKSALVIAEQLVTIGEQEANDEFVVEAFMVKGLAEFFLGRFLDARESFSHTVDVYAKETHRHHAVSYGQDPKMIALAHLAWLEMILGNPAIAIEMANSAVAHARELNHPFSITYALVYSGATLLFAEQLDAADNALNEALGICTKQHIRGVEALGLVFKAMVDVRLSPSLERIGLAEKCIADYEKTTAKIYLSAWNAQLAQAYLAIGHTAQAARKIQLAEDQMHTFDERWYEYPLRRIQAASAKAQGELDNAQDLEETARRLIETTHCSGWASSTRFSNL